MIAAPPIQDEQVRTSADDVEWADPCPVCGSAAIGCLISGDKVGCRGLDNGQGQARVSNRDGGRYWLYDLTTFRWAPAPDTAIRLLRTYFLSREDVLCFAAPWKSPCPILAGEHLDAILRAHCGGDQVEVQTWQRNESKRRLMPPGNYRIGGYAPALDGTTKSLCLDCDGGGDHSSPLADPLAVALTAQRRGWDGGILTHLERSKSRSGWHLWAVFSEPVSAKLARELGRLLAPADALLADGDLADVESGVGLEVFPKADVLRGGDGAVGNQVWLPWFCAAAPGGNVFYRRGPTGSLVPYVPDDFETITPTALERAIATLKGGPRA